MADKKVVEDLKTEDSPQGQLLYAFFTKDYDKVCLFDVSHREIYRQESMLLNLIDYANLMKGKIVEAKTIQQQIQSDDSVKYLVKVELLQDQINQKQAKLEEIKKMPSPDVEVANSLIDEIYNLKISLKEF